VRRSATPLCLCLSAYTYTHTYTFKRGIENSAVCVAPRFTPLSLSTTHTHTYSLSHTLERGIDNSELCVPQCNTLSSLSHTHTRTRIRLREALSIQRCVCRSATPLSLSLPHIRIYTHAYVGERR